MTSTLAFEGDGLWREYEGSVQDWLVQSRRSREIAAAALPATAAPGPAVPSQNAEQRLADERQQPAKKKLSYKDQRELDQLPELIEALEAEQRDIQEALADGTLYSSDGARATTLHAREGEIEEALMEALERWSQLST